MSRLSFFVPTEIDVPVHVYDSELALVDRRLSSEELDVEPGLYSVVAQLPHGGEASVAIEVGEEAACAELKEDPRRRWSEPAFIPHLHRPSRDAERLLHLDLLHSHGQIPHSRFPTVIFIPRGHEQYFAAIHLLRPDGRAESAIGLAHGPADTLLGYLQRGLFEDARLLSESDELLAETLLFAKRQDPVAAAAGAFALLYLGALDRLHDWTSNLAEWFEWLPDGQVALAEHMARLGKHEVACELLRDLPKRGIPALSVAVSCAADRLRTYRAHWPQDGRVRSAQRQLAHVAAHADVQAKVTTIVEPDREFLALWQERYGI